MNMQKPVYVGVMCLAVAVTAARADVWQDLAGYRWGDESKAPEQLMKLVEATPADQLDAVEQRLVAVLTANDATVDGKSHACRMLQRMGSDLSVPALARLLLDPELSDYARLPLQRMTDSAAAGKALRDALGNAPDKVKPGIIGSIGERRDADAVDLLSRALCGADQDVTRSALQALGKIGTKTAAEAVDGAKVDQALEPMRLDALLTCADALGDAAIYAKVYAAPGDAHRVAALRGLIRTDAGNAGRVVVDLLKGDDSFLRRGALRLVVMEPGRDLTVSVAEALKGFSADKQAEVIGALSERGDKAALDAITGCLKRGDEAVRPAAIAAVAALGGAGQVEILLAAGAEAVPAVARMTDPLVDAALLKLLSASEVAPLAVKTLALRDCVVAVPPLLGLTVAPEPALRQEAWQALAALASDEHADLMMKALLTVKGPDEKKLGEDALKKLCRAARDKNRCFDAIAAHYDNAEASTQALILELGAITGSGKALDLAREALANPALRDRALRALTGWSSADAGTALLALAQESPDAKERILALRGYVRVAGVDQDRPSWKDKLKMYQSAYALADRPDEKRLIISGLRNVKRPEAMKQLETCLEDEAVKTEAALAALDLGWDLRKNHRGDVAALAERILESATDKGVISKAKRNYNETKPKDAPNK